MKLTGTDRVQGMVGAAMRWKDVSPKAVVSGSTAQAENVLNDARTDILALWKAYVGAIAEREENARLRSGADAWQPIETAPKDGRSIIGYTDEFCEPLVLHWQKYNGLAAWRDWDGDPYYRVTHWMHLPPPPNTGGE